MNRLKLYLALFILSIASFLNVNNIYCVFTSVTEPENNTITIKQTTSYTVIHELMDLNGTTYTEHSRTPYTDVPIGSVVTPAVLTNLEGYEVPATQTVTLDFINSDIVYRYPRKQYTLTITNSNYVTTSTPSGTYYYGQPITLVAAATDNDSNPFVKWTNNETNTTYSFTMTDDITIGPIYGETVTVTYVPNNGDSQTTDTVAKNFPIGTLPTVTYDDCVGSTGDYLTRQCTEVYKFEGWYTESTFVNKVDETYVPTADVTLYAKWNKIFFAKVDAPYVCSGSNVLNTGIQLFSTLNADKDFIVKFTLNENNGNYTGNNTNTDRGTIFTCMNEGGGEPYAGVAFYAQGNKNNATYTMNINVLGNKVKDSNTGYVVGQSVTIKKINGYVYYSYDNGPDVQINDFENFANYFNNNATFCAGTNASGNPYRYFKGTISDLSVELLERSTYTIHFDANGGSGTMPDQIVNVGRPGQINPNAYTYNDGSFEGWNTAADGSGTSYVNNYAFTSDLGNTGDTVTLYAQWTFPMHFYVHFDANGGTGSMANQQFTISAQAVPLTQNAFTKTDNNGYNYEFKGWNTAADGSGTHYDDMEAIRDLSNIDEDVVTLYAEWMRIVYSNPGNIVFDGTANTFIDTGINVFDQDPNNNTFDKDFEIRFTFVSVDSDQLQYTSKQPTIFNVKDESNQYMPGFNIRFNSETSVATMTPTYKWAASTGGSTSLSGISTSAPVEFIYKRVNGVITMQYKRAGTTSQVYTLINQGGNFTLNQPFATNVAFGGYFDSNNQPGRFFKGTLADIVILLDE